MLNSSPNFTDIGRPLADLDTGIEPLLNFRWQREGSIAGGGKPSRLAQCRWIQEMGFEVVISLEDIPDASKGISSSMEYFIVNSSLMMKTAQMTDRLRNYWERCLSSCSYAWIKKESSLCIAARALDERNMSYDIWMRIYTWKDPAQVFPPASDNRSFYRRCYFTHYN